MKTVYVTGCDANYFLMAGILLEAFKTHCPGKTLLVCDFGLTPQQRTLLSKSGILLSKPDFLPENQHPWVYKSSLYHYIKSLSADIVVWMDSDCFPTGPFTREVDAIVSRWKPEDERVALCQGKVGKTWQLASPEGNRKHFSMDPAYPYYNSGVWILQSQRVLREWAAEIERTPKKGMFEQDAFNYLLFKHGLSMETVDNDRWNVTHDSLNHLSLDSSGTVRLDGNEVLIIHITGEFSLLTVAVGPLKGAVRVLKNEPLKDLQLQLLKQWVISLYK